jgi:hypothetical protein
MSENESSSAHASRIRRTVLPEVEEMVSIQTLPKAVCFLSHDGSPGQRFQLDADDSGIVRFHVKAERNSQPIEFTLECTAEGGTKSSYAIQLDKDTSSTARGSQNVLAQLQAANGEMRAPLADSHTSLSNSELLARGYPPHPDPVQAPARYKRWLRMVSQPFVAVTPRMVPHPGVSFTAMRLPPELRSPTLPLPPPVGRAMFNNSNSNAWSGAYATNPIAQYFWIQANWMVPRVFYVPGTPSYSAVSEWVGLDNSPTDLYQAGSWSDVWHVDVFNWTVMNYWMWIESLPFAGWGVPNFPIFPGDEVSVDMFVADENGTMWFANPDEGNGGLTPADNSVWFILFNYTRRLLYAGTLPVAGVTINGNSSTGFTGSTAEFILERPQINGTVVPLANFVVNDMYSCDYGDSEYGYNYALNLGPSEPIYLNMQDSSNNHLLDLTVAAPDPTNPRGYRMIWFWADYL